MLPFASYEMLETEYHNLRIFCLRAERKTQSSNVLKREQEVKQSVNTQQKNLEKKQNNYCTLNMLGYENKNKKQHNIITKTESM